MSSLKNANMSEWRAGALATPIGCCVRPVPDVRIAGRPTRGVCHVGFHGETNDFFFGGGFFLWPFSLFFLGLGYTLGFRGRVQGPLGDKPAEEAGCRGEMQKKEHGHGSGSGCVAKRAKRSVSSMPAVSRPGANR